VAVKVQVSVEIRRPVADVWRFWAVEHVRNHPRWDPDIELEQISEGPMGIGTKIRRRNIRWETPVDGEMEVVEFEPEHAIAFLVHDANMEMHGRTTLEPAGPERTSLTVTTDIPGIDDPAASELITNRMRRSVANVKELVEASGDDRDLGGRP
jgi:uncharacterized protein YndB with AHSA1/START domain